MRHHLFIFLSPSRRFPYIDTFISFSLGRFIILLFGERDARKKTLGSCPHSNHKIFIIIIYKHSQARTYFVSGCARLPVSLIYCCVIYNVSARPTREDEIKWFNRKKQRRENKCCVAAAAAAAYLPSKFNDVSYWNWCHVHRSKIHHRTEQRFPSCLMSNDKDSHGLTSGKCPNAVIIDILCWPFSSRDNLPCPAHMCVQRNEKKINRNYYVGQPRISCVYFFGSKRGNSAHNKRTNAWLITFHREKMK